MEAVFRPKSPLFIISFVIAILTLLGLWTVSDATRLMDHRVLGSADYIAASVCHRIPTHGFTLFGRALPLCARCSGIYSGIMLSFMMIVIAGRTRHASFPPTNISFFLFSLIALMGFDGLNALFFDLGLTHFYEPHMTLRLLTGLGAGLAIGVFVFAMFAQTIWQRVVWQASLHDSRELLSLLLLAVLMSLLILSNQPTILFVLAIVSTVGVVAVLGMLYTILVLIVLRRESFGVSSWHVIPPYAAGLLIAMVQIMLMATFRYNLTGSLVGF